MLGVAVVGRRPRWIVPPFALAMLVGCSSSPIGGSGATGPVAGRRELRIGHAPLCEASAAVRAPWDPGLVVVADNEVDGRLFVLRIAAGDLLGSPEAIALPGAVHPEDVEALAALGDRVAVVGSHGRTRYCERRRARERVELVAFDPGGRRLTEVAALDHADRIDRVLSGREACLEALFVDPPPTGATALCAAIGEAEKAIDRERCVPPLDVEGAAGVPSPEGDRLWLGLRRPRIDGRSVLVRAVPGLDELRLDRVAFLDVGGRGIRALASGGDGYLWAILGPGPPAFAWSSLWRAPLAALAREVPLAGEIVADHLPPSSEALVLFRDRVLVLTDGEEAATPGSDCSIPATEVVVPLG